MQDAGIAKLALEAQRIRTEDPGTLASILQHIEQDHQSIQDNHPNDLEGWQRELEILAKDVALAKQEVQDKENEASGRGSSTAIGRELRMKLGPILALRLEEHHKSALSGKSGRHHGLIAPFLSNLDYLTVAHITLTTVFDCVGRGSRITTPLAKVFDQIGERLDHEAFFRFVKKNDPQGFSKIERRVLNSTVKGYEFRVKEADGTTDLSYNFMGAKDRMCVGDWAFGCVQSLTLWFEAYNLYDGSKKKSTYFLSLSPEGLKYRDLIQAAQDTRAYEAWPMVCPPLEWEFDEDGKVEQRGWLLINTGR